ncbi:MAG TPA: hydroxyisourate hydrolase [Candidatus Limnocylindrales bacterium]|nr:hydroxyisourate hydrolase [Candidatus Limnocylindrales bacterium]
MEDVPTISTHVLDTERGQPAQGIEIRLFRVTEGASEQVGGGTTDADGRIRNVLGGPLTEGEYQLEFSVDGPFFRRAAINFVVSDTTRSYHVPLLLAPYSLATYRGS